MSSIGGKLKQLRGSTRLNQDQFIADFNNKTNSNLKRAAYSHYEIGRNHPPKELIEKFASYHNVSIDYLHGKEEVDLSKTKKLTYKGRELSQSQKQSLKAFLTVLLEEDNNL